MYRVFSVHISMKIVSVLSDPTIALPELTIPDTDYSTGSQAKTENLDVLKYGYATPLIKVLGYIIPNITYCKIVSGVEFLPTLIVTFTDLTGEFRNSYYPKDGDVASLYIRSKNPDFKHIRGEYSVLTVKEAGNTITITAEMLIPGIRIPVAKSYPNKSSLEVCKDVAKELGLGVSSNVDGDTKDNMTWINPMATPLDFLTQQVVPHAYSKDGDYYTTVVDLHYYLNYVEPSSIHTDLTVSALRNITSMIQSEDYYLGNGGEADEGQLEAFFLSNHSYLLNTNKRILQYELLNSSSSISTALGHRQVVFYYNKKTKQMEEFFHETVTSTDPDAIILKGKKEDDHTKNVRYVNRQVQSENVHESWNYALLANRSNNRENGKITLRLTISGINTELNLFQVVPVIIFNTGDSVLNYGDSGLKGTGMTPDSVNNTYTGNYMITALGYEYDPGTRGGINTVVLATKREFISITPGQESQGNA